MTSERKFEFLVIVPDNANCLEARMKIRPYVPISFTSRVFIFLSLIFRKSAHIEGVKPDIESGFWKMGGAFLFLLVCKRRVRLVLIVR